MIAESKKSEKFVDTIEFIYQKILLLNDNEFNRYSLHYGKAGLLVFLANYYKIKNDKNIESQIQCLIEEIVLNLKNDVNKISFSHGVSGMIWALKYVNNLFSNCFFDDDFFDILDREVLDCTKIIVSNGELDFMHDGLGSILPIIDTENKSFFIDKIINHSLYDKIGHHLWLEEFLDEKYIINLGLAHGQPAMWYFLSLLLENEQDVMRISTIVEESYKTMVKYFSNPNAVSRFAAVGYINKQYNFEKKEGCAPLSWCYSDLTIANTLVLLGKKLKNNFLYAEGEKMAINTINRDTFESAGFKGLCLCHGASSCICVYDNLYHLTNNVSFQKTSLKWAAKASEFINTHEKLFFQMNGARPEYLGSMLDGYVGLGLSLISLINTDEKLQSWKRCILLR